MQILMAIDGPVGRISFNRPDVRNALSLAMWKALPATIAHLIQRGARVIVISGQAGAFAAGADIAELAAVDGMEVALDFSQAIADGVEAVAMAKATTIAMIDGPCMGGGCLIAAACDLRYASQSSIFSLPIARLGIVLDQINVLRIAALIGPAYTKELIYTSDTIDSITAHNIGLINNFFATGELLEKYVLERARQISSNSLASILGAKATIGSVYNLNKELPEALRGPNAKEVAESYFSPDLKARLAKILGS